MRGSILRPLRRRRPPSLERLGGSNSLKEAPRRPAFLPERTNPLGNGRLGEGSTTMSRAVTMIRRLTADSARRSTPQRLPVERPRQSLDCTALGEPDHGEEAGHDAEQRLAIAFDGKVPVHAGAIELTWNIVNVRISELQCEIEATPTPSPLHKG